MTISRRQAAYEEHRADIQAANERYLAGLRRIEEDEHRARQLLDAGEHPAQHLFAADERTADERAGEFATRTMTTLPPLREREIAAGYKPTDPKPAPEPEPEPAGKQPDYTFDIHYLALAAAVDIDLFWAAFDEVPGRWTPTVVAELRARYETKAGRALDSLDALEAAVLEARHAIPGPLRRAVSAGWPA